MGIYSDQLQAAAFPDDYAGIAAEVLSITPDTFPAVKDALYALRGLSDAQFQEVIAGLSVAA